jgi:ribonuclease P protein component
MPGTDAPAIDPLKKRADFLATARARRQAMPGLVVQARCQGGSGPMRLGITCSRKVGNAVTRNRAKRRLRAVARDVLPEMGQAGWDYVLIGRAGATVTRPFAELTADLTRALARIHGDAG